MKITKHEWKKMSVWEKCRYVVHTYFWEAIFTVYLCCLLGSWIYIDYVKVQPSLRVEMIDADPTSANEEAFDTFMEGKGLSCNKENVELSKAIQITRGSVPQGCDPDKALFCKIMIGRTDLYFWDDKIVEASLAELDLVDLRTVLPRDTLEACADRLVYTAPLLRGGFPCGISLQDNEWVRENGFYNDCAVGVSRNAADLGLVTDFLKYITQ